jgi:uncharacterized protein DUF1360
MSWLLLVGMALATFRLTRLVVEDDFPPVELGRAWVRSVRPVQNKEGDPNGWRWWWGGELVSCYWCASGWISGGTVLIVWALHGMALPVLWWFAVWGLATLTYKAQTTQDVV